MSLPFFSLIFFCPTCLIEKKTVHWKYWISQALYKYTKVFVGNQKTCPWMTHIFSAFSCLALFQSIVGKHKITCIASFCYKIPGELHPVRRRENGWSIFADISDTAVAKSFRTPVYFDLLILCSEILHNFLHNSTQKGCW